MATNIVTVSGMFGGEKTYFAGSPVVIDISGLKWPTDEHGSPTSPFNVVRVEVVYSGKVVGYFRSDTGGQSTMSFDISTALMAIWSDYTFEDETGGAQLVLQDGKTARHVSRAMRSYILRIYTEYMASDDGGVFTETQCQDAFGNKDIPGGRCLIGALTEWERSTIPDKADADASHWEHTGVRNGDASTKPTSSPERVGRGSITSWVDVQSGYTKSIFYPAGATPQPDDSPSSASGWTGHAPIVLRDTQDYADFLFVNRRGAVETCSALVKESMQITAETRQYARIERPTFKPSRTVMAVTSGGRRSWAMSSGHQTRDWLEWWTMEFLHAERVWMVYKGGFTPVVVEPAKKNVGIYDRAKQQLESVEFTVTLALEG